MTSLTLISNSNNNIDLVLEAKKVGEPVTEITIQELIDASTYTSLFINRVNIKNAITDLSNTLKSLQADQTGIEIRYQILERHDATITITIAPDEMSATAQITTALGGKHLSAKAILNEAQSVGVKKGFSKEALVKLAKLAGTRSAGPIVSLDVALGKKAIKGKSARIKNLVQSAQERILQPKNLGDGTVDMRDLGDIICVNVGDPLAQKVSLTKGSEGYTVTGNLLYTEPGEDITLNAGEGTSLSPKNDDLLISTLDGLPKMIENGMEVDEVYIINNVDVATGNIDFIGSVIINGDVCEAMKVFATGDITIAGCVESATLKAGGDITIIGGIIGKKQDVENSSITDLKMSTNIWAKGKIYAKYCQYAEIFCGYNMRIENQLMHSVVNIGGRLWLGSDSKANGKLIGGYIKVGTSVSAGIIGATAGSNTFINFETIIMEFQKSQVDIDKRLKTETDIIEEIQSIKKKMEQLPKDNSTPKIYNKLVTNLRFHSNKKIKILEEKITLDTNSKKYITNVYVEATDKLYHGVELIVGDLRERSRREYGPSRMICKEYKIYIDPIINT